MKFVDGWLDVAKEYNISSNSWDRGGVEVTHLVVHGTAGGSTGNGTMAYMGQNGVSTHFAISTNGDIWQGISCDQAAWGNAPLNAPRLNFARADLNPNLWTISAEFCKPDTTNQINITDAQKTSGFALIQFICETYNIPKKQGDGNGGIISHADINSIDRAHCPGTFPWSDLWAFLKGASLVATTPNQYLNALNEWAATALSFPGDKSPDYTTGIAKAWTDRVCKGQHLGPPLSNEYDSVDWAGHKIRAQEFANAHAEWSNGSCRFFDGRGEIL